MKRYLSPLTVLFLLSGCVSGQLSVSPEQETLIQDEVEQSFGSLAEAAKTLDHQRYFSFFDNDNFSILNADGSTLNSLENFKTIYLPQVEQIKAYDYLEFDPVNINVIDANTAVLVNEFSAEITLKSGDKIAASGGGAQFWSKRTGEWKLVHVSSAAKD